MATTTNTTKHDVSSILFSAERDFLFRNNGDQVKADSLKGKTLGLYFSSSSCILCLGFTQTLAEVYNELLQLNKTFEVVFVSCDEDKESFDAYFSKMPWLANPFSDSKTRNQLNKLFDIGEIPSLVILDETGEVLVTNGRRVIDMYEAEAFPFTSEHLVKLEEQYEEAKKNQSLKSLLVNQSRDYVISADGKEVPVAELEGKTAYPFTPEKFAELEEIEKALRSQKIVIL